jgi:hypothetical protein
MKKVIKGILSTLKYLAATGIMTILLYIGEYGEKVIRMTCSVIFYGTKDKDSSTVTIINGFHWSNLVRSNLISNIIQAAIIVLIIFLLHRLYKKIRRNKSG